MEDKDDWIFEERRDVAWWNIQLDVDNPKDSTEEARPPGLCEPSAFSVRRNSTNASGAEGAILLTKELELKVMFGAVGQAVLAGHSSRNSGSRGHLGAGSHHPASRENKGSCFEYWVEYALRRPHKSRFAIGAPMQFLEPFRWIKSRHKRFIFEGEALSVFVPILPPAPEQPHLS